jgi:hypothetical protein
MRGPGLPRGAGIPGLRGRRSLRSTVVALLVMAALGLYYCSSQTTTAPSTDPPVGRVPRDAAPAPRDGSDGGIAELFRRRQSDVIVQASGTIAKVLPDDNETADGSSRHQRFIVRLPGEGTILLSHNIDLAPRVPAADGDTITFKGEYEWTDRGGVVHWTHHDPRRQRPGGWVEHRGKRYE